MTRCQVQRRNGIWYQSIRFSHIGVYASGQFSLYLCKRGLRPEICIE